MQGVLVLTHAVSTCFMVGLIWTIQIVHYPLFSEVGEDAFRMYHVSHGKFISFLVMPMMVIELLTALALIPMRPVGVPVWMVWSGAALVGAVWLSTLLLQIPAHNVLAGGFDPDAHNALVQTNWVRTLCWSLRGGLVVWSLGLLLEADRLRAVPLV